MKFNEYLESIFGEEEGVKQVYCCKCTKDMFEKNKFKITITYKGKKYWYTWKSFNGIIIVKWCEV